MVVQMTGDGTFDSPPKSAGTASTHDSDSQQRTYSSNKQENDTLRLELRQLADWSQVSHGSISERIAQNGATAQPPHVSLSADQIRGPSFPRSPSQIMQ